MNMTLNKLTFFKKQGLVMQIEKCKTLMWSIIYFLIFCVILMVSFCLILYSSGGIGSESWFFSWIGLLTILGFNVAWIYTRLLLNKYKIIRALIVIIGISVSISALIIWALDKIDIHHMFG